MHVQENVDSLHLVSEEFAADVASVSVAAIEHNAELTRLEEAREADRQFRKRRKADLERTLRRFPRAYTFLACIAACSLVWLLVGSLCYGLYGSFWPPSRLGRDASFLAVAISRLHLSTLYIGQYLACGAASRSMRSWKARLEAEVAEL